MHLLSQCPSQDLPAQHQVADETRRSMQLAWSTRLKFASFGKPQLHLLRTPESGVLLYSAAKHRIFPSRPLRTGGLTERNSEWFAKPLRAKPRPDLCVELRLCGGYEFVVGQRHRDPLRGRLPDGQVRSKFNMQVSADAPCAMSNSNGRPRS